MLLCFNVGRTGGTWRAKYFWMLHKVKCLDDYCIIILKTKQSCGPYHLSRREDKTTETEDSAMAAEPIHGCKTRPMGINTPVNRVTSC